MSPSTPCLVWDLRAALAALYGLHQHQHQHQHAQQHQAHDYLMRFQSRNGRRKITSSVQNHVDTNNVSNHDPADVLNNDDIGSSWLACICILLRYAAEQDTLASGSTAPQEHQQQRPINYAEALFVAQTLVHRLRRVKISECIDVEFEPPMNIAVTNNHQQQQLQIPDVTATPQQVLQQYCHWIGSIVQHGSSSKTFDSLRSVLQNYHLQPEMLTDDRVKGEISLIVITSIVDSLTRSAYTVHHQSNAQQIQNDHDDDDPTKPIRSLLTTCSLAMTVIAARLRYSPVSFPNPSPQTEPIVPMILRSIQMIQHSTSTSSSSDDNNNNNMSTDAKLSLYFTCLTSLPEGILAGSTDGGGAYGRLSLDPRCYLAVANEIKTNGISEVWSNIRHLLLTTEASSSPSSSSPSSSLSPTSVRRLLALAESWARYVPLPFELVNETIPLVKKIWADRMAGLQQIQQKQQDFGHFQGLDPISQSAMLYWITIMESGTRTTEDILASSLIQNKNTSSQPNKKRQSSKSKKREAKVIGDRTTADLLTLAQNEVKHRGDLACHLASSTWQEFNALLQFELHVVAQQHHDGDTEAVDDDELGRGDGPMGAITACANACLPHLLLSASGPACSETDTMNMISVFSSISEAVKRICASPSSHIRSFMPETLYSFHQTLIGHLAQHHSLLANERLRDAVATHFYQCSMNLASQCGYPPLYFHDLTAINDDDLEIERNEARDVLRAVAYLPTNASPAIFELQSTILFQVLQACAQPIIGAESSIFPETALHAFSALAKPINAVAAIYTSDRSDIPESFNQKLFQILNLAADTYTAAGNSLARAFLLSNFALHDLLPLSRLYNLAAASLSPMLSSLVEKWPEKVIELMRTGIEVAIKSLLQIPELVAPSALRQTRYDIRGAMRTPGGEDHVGVLTLMRFSDESHNLSLAFVRTKEGILLDLCGVYDELKKMEERRGPGVYHGVGIMPKSRRILLNIICRLSIMSEGEVDVADQLRTFFETSRESIINLASIHGDPTPENLFLMCEHTFDLASFSKFITMTLFEEGGEASSRGSICLASLQNMVISGYRLSEDSDVPQETLEQWNRLRAAVFSLFDNVSPELPPAAANMIFALIQTETDAVIAQCDKGPTSTSRIFDIELISDEAVPPGLFIQVLSSGLDAALRDGQPLGAIKNLIGILHHSRQHILTCVSCMCPSPAPKAFHDPRPVLAEIWFFAMAKLSKAIASQQAAGNSEPDTEIETMISDLMIDSCAVAICLLLRSSLGKTHSERIRDQQGMTLDGPQGLCIIEYFPALFDLGPELLGRACRRLVDVVPVQIIEDHDKTGVAIIFAALHRAAAGGLPPWAVESTPVVYSSLFRALNSNSDHFRFFLSLSLVIRLSPSNHFGSIEPGGLLAGPPVEKMSDKSKNQLLDQAQQIANANDAAGWRRLKAVIKKASGGKKKDTDFNQKPALTRFETLDRV